MTVRPATSGDVRAAWLLVLPAAASIGLVALTPIAWTFWESLHLHDLRTPWLGRPFVGLDNYAEAAADPRFLASVGHTLVFTAASVTLEMALGLALALGLRGSARGRGLARTLVLLSWATPTVVAALLWRFMFESAADGFVWFADPVAAWVPIVLADVWKMTPFVALLLLAGLQAIDPALYEAARVDGAGPWRQFVEITLPLLAPAFAVTLLFRTLDALRVFDLVYVLTAGGPGTATEPISLYTFTVLLQHLRFGYGSALSVIVFAVTFVLALAYIRAAGRALLPVER
jgi:ABC-type sugar transport system permease subunit